MKVFLSFFAQNLQLRTLHEGQAIGWPFQKSHATFSTYPKKLYVTDRKNTHDDALLFLLHGEDATETLT